jgi:ferrochelatase
MPEAPTGVLLMTYGSPSSLADVPAYLTRIRGGREPDVALASEFTRRYAVIGGSPLIPITLAQAEALERRLGSQFRVRAGMRFSAPGIEEALRSLAMAGVLRVVALVLSPQWSPLIMGGYLQAIENARASIGAEAPLVTPAPAWHRQPAFVAAVADRIRGALEAARRDGYVDVPVLLTAHSLPRRVADREPEYLAQLRETGEAIAAAAGLADDQWTFCWQSAGHEPGEWMTPDFRDLMPRLAAHGHRAVLVAPVQFLADHLEILYDIDVGAREQAETAGLAFRRVESLNADPGLIEALAAVVEESLAPV